MFIGQTGSGKTTIARILSLALNCDHQERFGDPCVECRRNKGKFDIIETNASDTTGINDIRDVTSGMNYRPRSGNKTRVYILDEAQNLSEHSQNFLLKAFEDCPNTTVWIICTTKPEKILRTLRSRCVAYTVPSFGLDEATELIKKAIKVVGGDLPAADLAECLLEAGVTSPRLILMAVEKYLAGATPEEAARVELSTDFDVTILSTSVRRGNWDKASKYLRNATPEDTVLIRIAMMNYFKTILFDEGQTDRGDLLAWGIEQLEKATDPVDNVKLAVMTETIYRMCKKYMYNKL